MKNKRQTVSVELDFNSREEIRGILVNDQLNNVRELVSMITPETQANGNLTPSSLPSVSPSPRPVPRIIIIPAISPFTATGSISLLSVVVTAKPTIPIHENRRYKQRERERKARERKIENIRYCRNPIFGHVSYHLPRQIK